MTKRDFRETINMLEDVRYMLIDLKSRVREGVDLVRIRRIEETINMLERILFSYEPVR